MHRFIHQQTEYIIPSPDVKPKMNPFSLHGRLIKRSLSVITRDMRFIAALVTKFEQ